MNQKDILLIQDYLKDALSAEDKTAFELKLKSDEAFAKAFEFEKTLNRAADWWYFYVSMIVSYQVSYI